ncbi:MAG: SET domain-containing protein [Gammaproteobacteria bacterium]|nr:SET domain-containing protein [Gammaproteobacteria bacterium]
MIHPNTELRFVSPEIGYGIFATARIPKGTIVYVKDQLEIELTPRQYTRLDVAHRRLADKFSYIDQRGVRIISWDHAKYVNHNCDCNTMSTGYGFEIALRDIEAGDEVTDEYGLFNIPVELQISCGCFNCRQVLRPDDIDNYHQIWDTMIVSALQEAQEVHQPLWELLDAATRDGVLDYLAGREDYRSVLTLKGKTPGKVRRFPAKRSSTATSNSSGELMLQTLRAAGDSAG